MLAMQIAEFPCDSTARKLEGDKIFRKRSPTSHSKVTSDFLPGGGGLLAPLIIFGTMIDVTMKLALCYD